MKKHFLLTVISLFAITAFAAVGPQSVKVTFNGDNTEGWVASSGGSITSVADGVANVQMAAQSGTPTKYRADFQYNTTGFTMDKSKDVVWAIKLTTALPGTANSRKFEIQYNDGSDKWINGIEGPSGSLDCADGGKIYYFNLGADGLNKLSGLSTGEINIKQIHFIMADATELTDETAIYAVDWVASFETVNDLKSFANWDDDKELGAEAYFELLFRPNSAGTGYDAGTPKTGFEAANVEFEGNYYAGLFAVEYFMIENFSAEKYYSLVLTCTGNNSALSVWNFPYHVNKFEAASDIITKATAVVGIAPRATTGDINEPIASANIAEGAWTFNVPGYKLTVLATQGTKSLVGLLVSSKEAKTDNQKGKFASAAHTTVAHPSLTYAGVNAIINTTNVDKKQWSAYETLASAVSAASANDVITLFDDATISGSRMDIAKALTIQGATGEEKIICGVAANSIMVLANGEGDEHTVTLKNLVIDGDNVSRSKQTLEAAQNANICLDGVQFVNTAYSEVTGDVKNTGNKNIILKGTNVIPNGIYLNMNKRVKHEGATHTSPIKIVLANDYVPETYSIVLTCSDPTLYTAELADGTAWQLFKKDAQNELAGRTMPAHSYDLTVTAAGMATLVLGYDCPIPDGMKAYKLTNEGEADIYAKEQTSIKKNEPVLIIADADTYTFTSAVGVRLDEQADPVSGCLRGTYSESPVAVLNNDGAGTYNYILTKVGEEVGFFHANSDGTNKVSKNHAYLFTTYNATGMASAPKMRIVFHDQTATGIEDVPSADKAEKLLIDGVIYIRKADHLYRIDGQLVK